MVVHVLACYVVERCVENWQEWTNRTDAFVCIALTRKSLQIYCLGFCRCIFFSFLVILILVWWIGPQVWFSLSIGTGKLDFLPVGFKPVFGGGSGDWGMLRDCARRKRRA